MATTTLIPAAGVLPLPAPTPLLQFLLHLIDRGGRVDKIRLIADRIDHFGRDIGEFARDVLLLRLVAPELAGGGGVELFLCFERLLELLGLARDRL